MKTILQALYLLFVLCVTLVFMPLSSQAGSIAKDYTWLSAIGTGKAIAMAMDKSENLYTVEEGKNSITMYDGQGHLMATLSLSGQPRSIAVDGTGRLYVAKADTRSVEILAPDGRKLLALGAGPGEFGQPGAMAIDAQGLAYVADSKAQTIKVYGADGLYRSTIGAPGNEPGQFNSPTALAIDEKNGELLVADMPTLVSEMGPYEAARVQFFDLSGHYLRSFGNFGVGEGLLIKPLGIAVDASSRILLTDAGQNVVQAFDRSGVYLGTIYNLEQPLRTPFSIAVGKQNGLLYISSLNAETVEVYGRPQSYKVTATATTGGSIEPAGEINVPSGQTLTFSITPNQGYSILSLLVDGVDVGPVSTYTLTKITRNHTVKAKFKTNMYSINASASSGGKIKPNGLSQVAYGGSLTFTLTPNQGYHVKQLLLDGTDVGPVSTYTLSKIAGNHTVTAKFDINTYSVNASASSGGKISPSGLSQVAHGGSLTFTLTPNQGFHVEQLFVDGVDMGALSSYTLANITRNHTVEARFSRNMYSVNASASAGGKIKPDGLSWVAYNKSLTLTITPNQGYYVKQVLVDGVNKGALSSYTLSNIVSNHTVVAKFSPTKYSINASASAGGKITPSGLSQMTHGSSLTLKITPDQGYHVEQVLVDGVNKGALSSYTLSKIVSNHTVKAKFGLNNNSTNTSASGFLAEENLEDFELGTFTKFPWVSGGDGVWTTQEAVHRSGEYAAESPQLANGQMSFLETRLDILNEGEIGFWFAVSSTTELDFLRFLLDGEEQGRWFEEQAWTEAKFAVPSGTHTFRWEYVKDIASPTDKGSAWLDDVSFLPHEKSAFPAPDIKINNGDGPLSLGADETAEVSVAVAAGNDSSAQSEWFLIMEGPDGRLCYDPSENAWRKEVVPFWAGTLSNTYGHTKVVDLSGLDKGTYTLYFLIDMNKNGRLDKPAYSDTAVLNKE